MVTRWLKTQKLAVIYGRAVSTAFAIVWLLSFNLIVIDFIAVNAEASATLSAACSGHDENDLVHSKCCRVGTLCSSIAFAVPHTASAHPFSIEHPSPAFYSFATGVSATYGHRKAANLATGPPVFR